MIMAWLNAGCDVFQCTESEENGGQEEIMLDQELPCLGVDMLSTWHAAVYSRPPSGRLRQHWCAHSSVGPFASRVLQCKE